MKKTLKIFKTTALLIAGLSLLSLNNKTEEVYTNEDIGYQILVIDNVYDLDFCKSAIDDANWCGYRYSDKRNPIKFESGLEIELFSIQEMSVAGKVIEPECELSNDNETTNDLWKINDSGQISRGVKSGWNPKQKILINK